MYKCVIENCKLIAGYINTTSDDKACHKHMRAIRMKIVTLKTSKRCERCTRKAYATLYDFSDTRQWFYCAYYYTIDINTIVPMKFHHYTMHELPEVVLAHLIHRNTILNYIPIKNKKNH